MLSGLSILYDSSKTFFVWFEEGLQCQKLLVSEAYENLSLKSLMSNWYVIPGMVEYTFSQNTNVSLKRDVAM